MRCWKRLGWRENSCVDPQKYLSFDVEGFSSHQAYDASRQGQSLEPC